MKRTSRDIRRGNRNELLRYVIARSPVSRQELAAATGLSLATVANLVGELLERGVLVEVGFEDSDGGRPRGLVAMRADGGALIGVDVAETYIHVELFDLALRLLARAEEPLSESENRPEQVVGHITSGVRAVLDQAGVDIRLVLGAGVSMPGQVEREGGLSVFAPNWNWRDVPLRDLLAGALDFPVYLDNPLMACTVAELWFGAARGCDDVIVVNLGTGVGAGIAVGGSLYRGFSNTAGEWGHTTLVLDGRVCHCGAMGCVEAYVGAPGILNTLREVDPDSAILQLDQATAIGALADALAKEDAAALETVKRTARYLGVAVGNLVNLLNPQVIVLSSWVAARLGTALLSGMREAVAEHALPRPLEHTRIMLCPIATNAVSLGAATFALEGALAPGKA
ncbi:ROK family transcriptional regulator [Actinocrinis puniceicyclus]|uniref:ROK family transcriptional regulator n=1 Tax=Actinocrinis puniceicyclus TaxID=977794 RepID=A0A8J7WNV9_9ACTN|nr:ROK family transcriptional regulator [Actinocrinis puniceicyclus]MBS2964743.1 ROK family transcriptional regulator [Actinocrinis puniceicyclus]